MALQNVIGPGPNSQKGSTDLEDFHISIHSNDYRSVPIKMDHRQPLFHEIDMISNQFVFEKDTTCGYLLMVLLISEHRYVFT